MHIHTAHKKVGILLLAVVTLYACHSAKTSHAAINSQAEKLLKQTISTLYKARDNLILRHEKDRQIQRINDVEQNDFYIFISYLDGRIFHYCRELYDDYGLPALSETPCPAVATDYETDNQYSAVPQLNALTKKEEVHQLHSTFEESLHQFDDMLLREQQAIDRTIPKARERSDSGNSGYTQSSGSAEKKDTPSGKQKDNQESNSEPKGGSATQSNKSSRTHGASTGSKPTETIGNKDLSHTDDDIVAKQLREAAEQETDPEIQEKLWEEYRKYKEAIR